MNNHNKSQIVITVGDESGIGPEIILKALTSPEINEEIDILVVGSKKKLEDTYQKLKDLGIKDVKNPKNIKIKEIQINQKSKNERVKNGNASFFYLKDAIKIVKKSKNSALVTGPICKKSWALAGHNYSQKLVIH